MPRKKKDEVIDAVIYEKKPKKKENNKSKTPKQEIIVEDTLEKEEKPYFFPRLVAYIIDILLVSLVCSTIMFLLPENKNYDKYMNEFEQVQLDLVENNITLEEYANKAIDIVYDIDYSNVASMIIEVVIIILYFIVFQFYNKGQTLGKKLMKLRVVSIHSDELTLNQMAYRSLIINSILVNILIIGSLLFLGRNSYYYASGTIQMIAGIVMLVTLFMILLRHDGRGIHDLVAGTKVIQEK